MQHEDRIDAEMLPPLQGLLSELPGGFNAISDLIERREVIKSMAAAMAAEHPKNENVLTEDRMIPGPEGAPDILIRLYRPKAAPSPMPAMFYIHGGGMIFGDINIEDPAAEMLCDAVGALVVQVEYRLAPEHPYPAAMEDCYATLLWMFDNAPEIGVDPARIAVYGGSAGGNLTLAMALLARDRSGPAISFQMAPYPMIDERNTSPASQEFTGIGIWDRVTNIEAWDWYLGGKPADQYAAPIHARDLSNLPRAFIDVGGLDVFRDETIEIANRMMKAGVETELHVYPGAYHAAEHFAPEAPLSQAIWARRIAVLRRELGTE